MCPHTSNTFVPSRSVRILGEEMTTPTNTDAIALLQADHKKVKAPLRRRLHGGVDNLKHMFYTSV
jgi:hypothetical protein